MPIAASRETLDFVRGAKTSTVAINGTQGKGFVVGPSVRGDQVLLAASLTMKPGEYAVTVSAVSGVGEERTAVVDVTLDPMQSVPSTATEPPVVLLNGWQFGFNSNSGSAGTCPISSGSSDTFGSLETQLTTSRSLFVGNPQYPGIAGAGVPVVYFFDNCVEDRNDFIENLGGVLGDVLNLIQYDNGTLVPQIDLVSHSMGGLIVRSYLSGLQTNGTPAAPPNPRVRKFIEIAAPNFGSFFAANNSILLAGGTQAPEMFPGSAFLWNLATWNQRGDDLRGVDALAIVGDAGYWQASDSSPRLQNLSDGVVSITSASLGFASLTYARSPSRTLLLHYCHIDSASLAGLFIDCSGGGIADVDQARETGAIILSFLENTSDWESIGTPNQAEYGGIYFALENAAGTQYTALEGVSLGSQSLQPGGSVDVYYEEFANGTGTLEATTTASQSINCGSLSLPGGYYSPLRFKYSPSIFSVQSSLSTGLPGLTVASSSTITISGVGFSSSTGTAVWANGAALSSQVVSDQEITASLPSTYGGLVGLAVGNSNGEDAINIFVAPPAQPTISLSSTQLWFSNTVGGASPVAQTVTVSNTGGGTLTYSVASNAPWLMASPSGSTVTVSVNPAGLAANTYQGAITVASSAASNSPQTISVVLTVSAPPFGSFDTPSNGQTGLAGDVNVSGWALSTIPVSVQIWRNPVPNETAAANGMLFVEDTTFVPGTRPDIATSYPGYLNSNAAGWGAQLLTNELPNSSGTGTIGNGTFTIHALGTDANGLVTDLGAHTITVNNSSSVLPFGSIDTPAAGATISGAAYVNFGWALTPQPDMIPADGSTINVFIDNKPVGHPVYNNPRSDIETLFPGYANTGGAIGYFRIDTTALTNGLHQIAWGVADNAGHRNGIGSRYFTVQN